MNDRSKAVRRITKLLDDADPTTVGTSMRIRASLREAATVAVQELGAASSTTALTTEAVRSRLEAIVMQAALDSHYDQHPELRPSLAELAVAAAELDGNPLASTPHLIRDAATAIVMLHPDADADAVLLWAEARAFTTA